jgi:hypothetical protein
LSAAFSFFSFSGLAGLAAVALLAAAVAPAALQREENVGEKQEELMQAVGC